MKKEVIRVHGGDSRLLQQLTELEKESFGEGGLSNEWLMVPMIKFGCVYVLYLDARLAGSAQLLRTWEDPETAYFYGLSLYPEYRGQGWGSKFMDDIFKDIVDQEFKTVFLTVHPENTAALHLYRDKFGFNLLEAIKNEYGPNEDRLVLRKDFHELYAPTGN